MKRVNLIDLKRTLSPLRITQKFSPYKFAFSTLETLTLTLIQTHTHKHKHFTHTLHLNVDRKSYRQIKQKMKHNQNRFRKLSSRNSFGFSFVCNENCLFLPLLNDTHPKKLHFFIYKYESNDKHTKEQRKTFDESRCRNLKGQKNGNKNSRRMLPLSPILSYDNKRTLQCRKTTFLPE